MPRSPPPLSVLQLAVQTGLHPLWKVHLWVSESPSSRSSCLLQGLGCAVPSLHAVVQGNMCRVTLGHGGVQAGTVPREWLLRTSFREAEVCNSAFLVTVQLQASPMDLCLVRQVPAAPSALPQASPVWPSPGWPSPSSPSRPRGAFPCLSHSLRPLLFVGDSLFHS